ncbi:unnamed protein product [Clonostachys rosea]|uniref:Uncharacterized protein n=1 Tax=Bionectria ochroleuca TaxID=29856 RepID=A0ABY6TQC8_BIOOC|nr:unnamed protein product [Clonostachys rosea]
MDGIIPIIQLLYPTDYWSQWPEGSTTRDAMEKAVANLENYLEIKRDTIDLSEHWRAHDPSGDREPLATYLENV